MIRVDRPYRRHRRFHHRHLVRDQRLDRHLDDQHHQGHRSLHRLELPRHRRSLGAGHRSLHLQDDRLHRDRRLGDLGHRHQPGDLDHLGDLDRRHQPDDPDPGDPCPATERTGCFPDEKLDAGCPYPGQKRMGCYRGVECPGLPMVHPALAYLPKARMGSQQVRLEQRSVPRMELVPQ